MESPNSPEENGADEQVRQLLKMRLTTARENFENAMKQHGASVDVMGRVMEEFISALPPLPEEAACKGGCAHCCHMGQGVSIPEALIVFHALKRDLSPGEFEFFKARVLETAKSGTVGEEAWWRQTQTPCPFLDVEDSCNCLIYNVRPFSCRAYHSIDEALCREGFEGRKEIQVPCFTLFRTFNVLHALAFIQGAKNLGLHSTQVGFTGAMALLFEDENATEKWLAGEDVFKGCGFE